MCHSETIQQGVNVFDFKPHHKDESEKRTKRVVLLCTEAEHSALNARAASEGRDRSDIIRDALRAHLQAGGE
jgi:rRNA pseudouridine-1189 N-methylase Emg1 (Nep1/Mra1 family)